LFNIHFGLILGYIWNIEQKVRGDFNLKSIGMSAQCSVPIWKGNTFRSMSDLCRIYGMDITESKSKLGSEHTVQASECVLDVVFYF